jgi:hypothetical protein
LPALPALALDDLMGDRPGLNATSAMPISRKAIACSAVHLIAAVAVYRYLITGGWLTNHYQLNDPNIVNLFLAIFEPVAVLSVIAFWISRRPGFQRLMSILCVVQILIGVGFLVFFLVFAMTWHPKMM